jgi:hypothetical protein
MTNATPRALAALIRKRLDAMERVASEATPAPWFVRYTDDNHYMNARYVSTTKGPGRHDGLQGMGSDSNGGEDVVAITLLQAPCLACHVAERWDEDAAFIAAARSDVPALIAAIRAAVDGLMAPRRLDWNGRKIASVNGWACYGPSPSRREVSVHSPTEVFYPEEKPANGFAWCERIALQEGAWPDVTAALLGIAAALGIATTEDRSVVATADAPNV